MHVRVEDAPFKVLPKYILRITNSTSFQNRAIESRTQLHFSSFLFLLRRDSCRESQNARTLELPHSNGHLKIQSRRLISSIVVSLARVGAEDSERLHSSPFPFSHSRSLCETQGHQRMSDNATGALLGSNELQIQSNEPHGPSVFSQRRSAKASKRNRSKVEKKKQNAHNKRPLHPKALSQLTDTDTKDVEKAENKTRRRAAAREVGKARQRGELEGTSLYRP